MPRTWGYIIVALAALVGAGALMLPLPEQIEVRSEEPAPVTKPARAATPAATPRESRRATPQPVAPPKPQAPAPAPVPKTFPMQDTTKTRTMIPPQG